MVEPRQRQYAVATAPVDGAAARVSLYFPNVRVGLAVEPLINKLNYVGCLITEHCDTKKDKGDPP